MGFEADKIAENIRQKIKQFLSENESQKTAEQTGLTNAESEDLNQGLSGEHISAGFSDAEAEQLKENLSGKKNLSADSIEYTKTDETGKKQSITFYGEKREGFLDLTPDSLKYFSDKYPNASKAFFSNGIVTILDSNNRTILNENGLPLTIDYNVSNNTANIDLIGFYLNHAGDSLDVNKLFELRELQNRINSTPETDKNYKALLSEIEVNKLELMNEKERKNYMTTKMWNAFTNKDASAWFNALSEFYDYKCRIIDQKFGITGTKEFIKEKTHLNDLIAYIDKILDDRTDKLTKTELIWEIIKGIGDAIDSFIGTQGLTMLGVLGGATKAASSIPKIGPVLAGAIQAYFGTEGAVLLGSGTIDGASAETKDEARAAGAELGLGGIMAKGGSKSFIEGFKGLQVKAFRRKISEVSTIGDLDKVRKIIDESSFSKAEKQMLQNECAKKQGEISNRNLNSKVPEQSFTRKLNEKRVHSVLSYEALKKCKTPEQKEMAKIWLGDKKLYMATENMEQRKLYLDQILQNCTSENITVRKSLINKLLENPKFLDKNKVLKEEAIKLIKNITLENINSVIKMLDEYKKSNSRVSVDAFLKILNYTRFAKYNSDKLENIITTIIRSEKINPEQFDENINIINLAILSENGMTISGIPLEDVLTNPNLKKIANFSAFGQYSKGISKIQKTIIRNIGTEGSQEPIVLKTTEGKDIVYTDFIQTVLNTLYHTLYENNNTSLIEFAYKFFTDKTLSMDANGLLFLLNIIQTDFMHSNISRFNYNFEIFSYILKNPEFSKDNILQITTHTTTKSLNLSKKIIDKNNLTAQEKTEIISSIDGNNQQNIALIELILEKDCLNPKCLEKVIQATKIYDSHDAGGNNGKIDPKKVDRYLRLLQNPKTVDWTVKMLNENWDIETISRFAATKQNFYLNNKGETAVTDKNTCFFMDFGLNQQEAESIVKAISQNGTINTEMQQTAIDLINSGIPKNKIGQILSDATTSGDFNPRVPSNAMSLHGMGLNAFAERFLPIINNLSAEDIAVKFNSKIKNQLKTMIENIPEQTKPALRAKGFDLEGMLKKLDSKIVRQTKNGKSAKITSGIRNKSDITGFEKSLVEKYNPSETVWRSKEKTKAWAEEKYQAFKQNEYLSTRNTEQTKAEDINKQRKTGLKEWFDFMETDVDLKDNPFARVLISEFITRDLLPENSSVPPALDKTAVKKVLSEALNDSYSIAKEYKAELNNSAKQSSDAMEVEIDGRKMTWLTVPQTDSSHPDFKTNVAKVQALSDGTNWCIRTWNAGSYIQQGNIHFLVDETGMTQACIREGNRAGFKEDNFKGTIAEIQKRQQNSSVPVAYVDFIKDFTDKKKLKGYEDKIKEASDKKPEFDQSKTRLQKLAEKKDYKAILELMGINVKILPDGSWEISHYTSYMNEIALSDYGIKENDLLANVSIIKGNADFHDSNATSLPKLEEVGGELDFGYADISNLQKLKKINGKKINW